MGEQIAKKRREQAAKRLRCPKYMVMCKRGQRKVMKKLKNGCSRPVCVGKPIKPCPVYAIRCQRGQRTVMKKLRNGCSRPVCVGKPIIKPPVRCPKYRLRPCKGGSVRSWIKLKNGCKKPICKRIKKKCCRKFGRRKICSSRYCKERCPKYRLRPCKYGSVRSWITLKNGCKRPVCVNKPTPVRCCRKLGSTVKCGIKFCRSTPVTPSPVTPEPSQPVTPAPTKPDEPSKPVTQAPTKPDEPSKPVAKAPTKPDEPSKPVTQALTKPD